MKRREFLVSVGGAAMIRAASGAAQGLKSATIGFLAGVSPELEAYWRGLKQALRERGYVEGQNVRYEFRSAEQASRLPELAAELVRLKVDLIVTRFTPATLAAKEATHNIPIVMAYAGNPVENGLVASLARPGGNVTGLAGVGAERLAKDVELLREIFPAARHVVLMVNVSDPFSKPFIEMVRRAGDATGLAIEPKLIHRPEELDAAFAAVDKERPDGVVVQGSLPAKRAAELALRYRIPAWNLPPEDGGLMNYRVVAAEIYQRAAAFVDKILKGARPADLPVERPTRFELVINLKTAKRIGVTIPPAILARADQVIE